MTKKELQRLLIITTIIMLVPIAIGVGILPQLPDKIATHFGANGQPNGWHNKKLVVFGMPIFMIIVQYVLCFSLYFDPMKKNIEHKFRNMLGWLVPLIEMIVMFGIYGIALGYVFNFVMIINFMIGLLFVGLGNYLHKIKQNYTVGIKIPWTLHSKENWNRTHRVAAWLFVGAGILMLINGFMQQIWLMLVTIAILVILPIGYSFILYRKGI